MTSTTSSPAARQLPGPRQEERGGRRATASSSAPASRGLPGNVDDQGREAGGSGLEVVERGGRRGGRPGRPRRARRWGIVAGVVVAFVLVLGVVAVQVILIGGQRRLDQLHRELEVERTEQDALRREESQLRSPAEIRDIAAEELGMVPAETPLLVRPNPRVVGYPEGDPRGAGTPTTIAPAATPAPTIDPAAPPAPTTAVSSAPPSSQPGQ